MADAAPTKSKTWQYSINNLCYSSAQTDLEHHQKVMFQYVTCMLGFASYAWTCSGSSDSSTAGMDSTNRWVASTNLIWAASGAHSWIVLRQTGIATNFEVCIDLLYTTTPRHCVIVVSPTAGFTGGSTTARPTATDEHVILNKTAWCDDLSSAPYYQTWVHGLESNDGQCTRIFACQNNKVVGFCLFDIPKNPMSSWSPTCVYAWTTSGSSTTDVLTYAKLNDAANLYYRHSGTEGTFYCASMGHVADTAGQRIITANSLNNKWNTDSIVLCSTTATRQGQWGELFDTYWGSIGLGSTSAFEDSGYTKWVQLGNWVIPWNGTLVHTG